MRASRLLRLWPALVVAALLAACGGSDTPDTTTLPPTATIRYPVTAPVSAVVTLDGSSSAASGGRTLTYAWVLTSRPAGSTATIVGPTTAQPLLTLDVAGTYAVTLTVNDTLRSTTVSGSIAATASTLPTIQSDIVEPVSGTVQLSAAGDPAPNTVVWTVDGTSIGTGNPLAWDTTAFADGNHLVAGRFQFTDRNYYVDVVRTFQVRQSPVSFTASSISASGTTLTALVGAASTNGIVRVAATLDGTAIGTLTAPNACLDSTGAACASSGPNGYSFAGTVAAGQHVVVVTATDGAGNQLAIQLRLTTT